MDQTFAPDRGHKHTDGWSVVSFVLTRVGVPRPRHGIAAPRSSEALPSRGNVSDGVAPRALAKSDAAFAAKQGREMVASDHAHTPGSPLLSFPSLEINLAASSYGKGMFDTLRVSRTVAAMAPPSVWRRWADTSLLALAKACRLALFS
eukprot:TRINITY_DN45886_c0_g1_i1.p1 TRINITY_DN45886_c0_g1~~TRINITY_DN45886_c0_g1_i1.p1  ORF type:complete len:148 (+),score=8.00 TRINITY_DN45886_c0_g1_i1:233-676(+)